MSILLENISKYYGTQPILSQLSLEVEAGELFVLLGASGSGKSTLLRVIAGLTTLDSGRVILHDRDVTELPPQQRAIGFVFQNYSLFRHMTVADNIAFALDVQQVARPERDRRVTELLSLIDLSDCADRLPAQLSGGQQQRVALARALAHQPAVLLLDEPFGALDTKIRIQLRQNLRAVQQRLGVTTILVTHDQDEAFELADRIGIIEQGRLLEIGTSGDLYHAPRYRYTARFLGTTNMLPGHWHDGKLIVGSLPPKRIKPLTVLQAVPRLWCALKRFICPLKCRPLKCRQALPIFTGSAAGSYRKSRSRARCNGCALKRINLICRRSQRS